MNEWMMAEGRKECSTMTHQATVVGMDRERRTETLVLLHTTVSWASGTIDYHWLQKNHGLEKVCYGKEQKSAGGRSKCNSNDEESFMSLLLHVSSFSPSKLQHCSSTTWWAKFHLSSSKILLLLLQAHTYIHSVGLAKIKPPTSEISVTTKKGLSPSAWRMAAPGKLCTWSHCIHDLLDSRSTVSFCCNWHWFFLTISCNVFLNACCRIHKLGLWWRSRIHRQQQHYMDSRQHKLCADRVSGYTSNCKQPV